MQRHVLTSTTALLLCLGPACGDDGGSGETDGATDGTSGSGSTSVATDSATGTTGGTSAGTSAGTSGATDGTTSSGTTDGTSTGTAGTTGGGVEICDNGSDDDGDTLADCQDPAGRSASWVTRSRAPMRSTTTATARWTVTTRTAQGPLPAPSATWKTLRTQSP